MLAINDYYGFFFNNNMLVRSRATGFMQFSNMIIRKIF